MRIRKPAPLANISNNVYIQSPIMYWLNPHILLSVVQIRYISYLNIIIQHISYKHFHFESQKVAFWVNFDSVWLVFHGHVSQTKQQQ